jgi:hypothetical protein
LQEFENIVIEEIPDLKIVQRYLKQNVLLLMAMEKLLFYSPGVSPRLRYIASHLVVELLGGDLDFTCNRDEAISAAIPLINYSASPVPGAVNVCPAGLLEQENIAPQSASIEFHEGLPVLFRSIATDDPGFDLFAASFYMLSRYEEYLPHSKDRHGRFPFSESLAFAYGLAMEPLVELWAGVLRNTIKLKYPHVVFPDRQFTFLPTIDIDIPWAYRNRGLWRTWGGLARGLLKGELRETGFRARVLLNLGDDPYDTWAVIDQIHDKAGLSPLFFVSAGTYSSFDKCVRGNNPEYRKLVSKISGKYRTGVHPSYFSYLDGRLMKKEICQLSDMTRMPVLRSRQHYLRLEMPVSYRLLAENGIREDYTMGWAESPGFRAGTCTPFLFYDLMRESVTPLKIMPFQIMDGTLRDYMELDPGQAASVARNIVQKIKDVRGTLVTLWHNQSFSEKGRWKGWQNVYIDIIKSAAG